MVASWPPRSTTSNARTPSRPGSANCACWRPTRRRTTGDRGSAPVVVGGVDRRGLPAVSAPRETRRHEPRIGRSGPHRRRRHRRRCWPGSPGSAHLHRRHRGSRRVHGPGLSGTRGVALPGARGVSAADYAGGPADGQLIDGADAPPWRRPCARWPTSPAGRATRRGAAARPPRRPSTCCGGASGCAPWPPSRSWWRRRPTGAGSWQLAWCGTASSPQQARARRGVPPMPVVEALRAAAQVTVLPQPAPLGGALLEETGLIARWLAAPGVRNRQRHTGFASPLGSAGRWASWAATARSARLAAERGCPGRLRAAG